MTTEVKDAVREFVQGRKLFTSVDVANEIKKAGIWKRNRDVARELRDLFSSGDEVFDGYDRCNISVDSDSKTAALYLPCGADPEDYTERNQSALGPVAAKQGGGYAPTAATSTAAAQAPSFPSAAKPVSLPGAVTALKRVPRTMTTLQAAQNDISDLLDTDIVMSKVIRTKERIKIPAGMIRKIGWKPGQVADMSVIKTHHAVKVGVIVAKDYRVSIPRSSVNWGDKPVKVMLTSNNEIIFDKA